MELYTLTSRFLPKESVGEFTSAIWTERYFSAGDVQIVVQPYPSMIEKLAKGTLLGLRGTKEIMMIETQSIENGLLTVTGSSLPKFLNERQAWFYNPEYTGADPNVKPFTEYASETMTAGQLISSAVDKLLINPVPYGDQWASINLDWATDKIQGLELGVVDDNGTPKRMSIPVGPLYDGIQRLAEEEGLGFKLYLDASSYTGTYVLKFATYRGKNRTSEQTANLLIRLSPKLDSLTDVKEVNSISNYKNVFYVVYKNIISTHYIPGLPIPTGFDRRVILVEAPDIYFNPELPEYADKVAAFREQVARNTIAQHAYIQAVDGRISPQIDYTFGTDYYLGDIIELEGFTGLLSKARVIEYIRSEDQFGEQAYPTLAVLDPLFIGYMPDLEPDPDFDIDFDEDPDFDFDFEDSPDWEDDPDLEPGDIDPRDPPDYNPDPEHDFGPEVPGDGDGDGDGGDGDGDGGTASEFLDKTYYLELPTDVHFQPPIQSPFVLGESAGTYTCNPGPGSTMPAIQCPRSWVDRTQIFTDWNLADFPIQAGGGPLEGSEVSFGNPPEGYPPFDFFTIYVTLRRSLNGSRSGTLGCTVAPPGWPGYGMASCGPNDTLSEVQFDVAIGVPIKALPLGDYTGLLVHASDNPDDWPYYEPDFTLSRALFDPNTVNFAQVSATFSGYNQLEISAMIELRPYSYRTGT